MKKLLYIFLASILISCTQPNPNTGDNKESLKQEMPEEKPRFKILENPSYDLGKLSYDGKIVNKKFWQDSNGENVVLFTQKEEELFVYHYVIRDEQANLSRRVYDFEKDCEFDRFLEFIEESIAVSDWDKNDMGEITFAYKKACISDVSPLDMKLLILENGEKYIIRGTTTISMGGESYGGMKNIDPSFEKAPASFLSHANEVWERVGVTRY